MDFRMSVLVCVWVCECVYRAAVESPPGWWRCSWCQQEAGWPLWRASGRKRGPKLSASVHVLALCKTALQIQCKMLIQDGRSFAQLNVMQIWQQLGLDPRKCSAAAHLSLLPPTLIFYYTTEFFKHMEGEPLLFFENRSDFNKFSDYVKS